MALDARHQLGRRALHVVVALAWQPNLIIGTSGVLTPCSHLRDEPSGLVPLVCFPFAGRAHPGRARACTSPLAQHMCPPLFSYLFPSVSCVLIPCKHRDGHWQRHAQAAWLRHTFPSLIIGVVVFAALAGPCCV